MNSSYTKANNAKQPSPRSARILSSWLPIALLLAQGARWFSPSPDYAAAEATRFSACPSLNGLALVEAPQGNKCGREGSWTLDIAHSAGIGPLIVAISANANLEAEALYDFGGLAGRGIDSLPLSIAPEAEATSSLIDLSDYLKAAPDTFSLYVLLAGDNAALEDEASCRPFLRLDLIVSPLTPIPILANAAVCSEDSPFTEIVDSEIDLDSLLPENAPAGRWEAIDAPEGSFDGVSRFRAEWDMAGQTYTFQYLVAGALPGSGGPCDEAAIPVEVRVKTCFAAVGERVWEDRDLAGDQGPPAEEPGIAGVELRLTRLSNGLSRHTQSDAQGAYVFRGLPAGDYRLEASYPPGMILTIANNVPGVDGHLTDSDGQPDIHFSIDEPTEAMSLDFGFIPEPNLEGLLRIVGVDFPQSGQCKRFNVIFEGRLRNTGQVPLRRLRARLDFGAAEAFGAAFVGLVAPPVILPGASAAETAAINAAYNGRAQTDLFNGQSGALYPGEEFAFRLVIEVFPEAAGAPNQPGVQMALSGEAFNFLGQSIPDYQLGGVFTARDLSSDRAEFQGGYDDEDSRTLLGECWRHTRGLAASGLVNLRVDEQCGAFVSPESILTEFFGECGRQTLPLGGYYRLFYLGEEVRQPIPAKDLVGKTINVQVRSAANDCEGVWGQVRVEDKTPPLMECPPPRYFACTDIDSILNRAATLDEKSPLFTGKPIIVDNCGDKLAFQWSDELLLFGCEGGVAGPDDKPRHAAIVRTFSSADASGNAASCRQYFYFDRPAIKGPDPALKLDFCKRTIRLDAAGNPHPDIAGYPFFLNAFGERIPLRVDEFRCDYSAAYQDLRFAGPCAGAYKVIRTWRVLDWCAGGQAMSFEQIIEVGDFSAPQVACNTISEKPGGLLDTLTFSTGPFNCLAAFALPAPKVSGECSSYTVQTEIWSYQRKTDPFGSPYGEPEFVKLNVYISNGVAAQVPLGVHYFIHTVSDACGNKTVSAPCVFKVVDKLEPIAICGDVLNVSLGGVGLARLIAGDIDKGSRDNCGPVSLSLRRTIANDCLDEYLLAVYGLALSQLTKQGERYFRGAELVVERIANTWYSSWAEDVLLTCCDVGSEVSVRLRVRDQAGNVNFCDQRVFPEDKIAPLCHAPAALSVDCMDLQGLDVRDTLHLQQRFGKASASDNCSAEALELSPVVNLDNCGVGFITRRFQALDRAGNRSAIVQQTIEVRPHHHYLIRFPADANAQQCGAPLVDSLWKQTLGCDLLALNIEERPFAVSGQECYKTMRTYRVINWCEYDGVSNPEVLGRDEDRDGVAGNKPFYLIRRPNGVFIDLNDNEKDGFLRQATSAGYWQYTQFISVYDTVPPSIALEPFEAFCSYAAPVDKVCLGPAQFSFTVDDVCTPNDISVKVFWDDNGDGAANAELRGAELIGDQGRYTVRRDFPIGRHRLIIRAVDGCGNQRIMEAFVEIVDCKAPSLVCRQQLVAQLMPFDSNGDGVADSALAVLRAADFLVGAQPPDCSGPLRYSIHRAGETPRPGKDTLVFTCEDVGARATVEIYVWDQANNPYAAQPDGALGGPNHDFCVASLEIQDNQRRCRQYADLAGLILTEEGQPVKGVSVRLNGDEQGEIITRSNGAYRFERLLAGQDYLVKPWLDSGLTNGVSTLDLVLITKHILGVEQLDSPYKIIAADANRSGNVSTLDLIYLRRLILGIASELPNGNTSWRFVPAGFSFPVAHNPWFNTFPESIAVKELSESNEKLDFIAIKVGDVTGNANVGNLGAPEARGGGGVFILRGEDMAFERGDETRWALCAPDVSRALGFQFTMSFDPVVLRLVSIQPGLLGEEHLGVFPEEGLITASWNQLPDEPRGDGEHTLVTLEWSAAGAGRLRDHVWVNGARTRAEAYDLDENTLDVALVFDEAPAAPAFRVLANWPNPFGEETTIAFHMPRAGELSCDIHDAAGRLLRSFRGFFGAGYQELLLERGALPAGVWFYTLRVEGQTLGGSMIAK